MKYAIYLTLMLASSVALACELQWDYEDSEQAEWIEGFRFYQVGVETGTAAPELRSVDCATVGLVPGPGPVTATAYRGQDESAHSGLAIFELIAPGLRIILSTP